MGTGRIWDTWSSKTRVCGKTSMQRRGSVERHQCRVADPEDSRHLAGAPGAVLLLLSPWDVYHLDGPLGGALNLGAELV
eukprot:s8627_g1.t1